MNWIKETERTPADNHLRRVRVDGIYSIPARFNPKTGLFYDTDDEPLVADQIEWSEQTEHSLLNNNSMNSDTMPTGRNMMPTGHRELENIPTLTQEQFDIVARKLTQGQLAHDTLQSIDLIADQVDLSHVQKVEMIEKELENYWSKTKG